MQHTSCRVFLYAPMGNATMIYIREYPTQNRLKELFEYIDGHLVWKKRPREEFKTSQGFGSFNANRAGKVAVAGKIGGYWVTKINKTNYKTHRLIWIFVNGDICIDDEIDHFDNDKLNYKIGNLRISDRSQNTSNRGAQSNSASGIKGVSWDKARGKWHAQVTGNGLVLRARFINLIDAVKFSEKARIDLHGEFHNHG